MSRRFKKMLGHAGPGRGHPAGNSRIAQPAEQPADIARAKDDQQAGRDNCNFARPIMPIDTPRPAIEPFRVAYSGFLYQKTR